MKILINYFRHTPLNLWYKGKQRYTVIKKDLRMTKKKGFEVYTRIIEGDESALFIRLRLEKGLSQRALRHIELEAKDAIPKALRPLKATIDEISIKDGMVDNPENDICEACQ